MKPPSQCLHRAGAGSFRTTVKLVRSALSQSSLSRLVRISRGEDLPSPGMSFFAAATADLNLFRCWKVPNYNSRQCRGRVAPTSQTGCAVRDSVPEPCEGRKKTEMTNRSDPLRPAGLGMFVRLFYFVSAPRVSAPYGRDQNSCCAATRGHGDLDAPHIGAPGRGSLGT
jgi:hypothetical protein